MTEDDITFVMTQIPRLLLIYLFGMGEGYLVIDNKNRGPNTQ